MCSEGYSSWVFVCVCVCVCVCVSVKSHLTYGVSACPENTVTYSASNGGQQTCRVFSETASFKSYGVICLPTASYSGIRRNFSMAELSKAFKKANSRLNTTWNTTQCKTAISLVSVFYPQIFRILPVTHISVVRALFRIRARIALSTLVHSWLH